jgi:hypothetical protein
VLLVGLPDLGLGRRLVQAEDHELGVVDNHTVLLRDHQVRTVADRLVHSVGGVEGLRMTEERRAALVEALAVGEGRGDPQRSN